MDSGGISGSNSHAFVWPSPAVITGGGVALGAASGVALGAALKRVDVTAHGAEATKVAHEMVRLGRAATKFGAAGVGLGALAMMDPNHTSSGSALVLGGAGLMSVGIGASTVRTGYSTLFRPDGSFSPRTPRGNIEARFERIHAQPGKFVGFVLQHLRK